jgi:uncharacterized protein YjbJ (UPF0337 family)
MGAKRPFTPRNDRSRIMSQDMIKGQWKQLKGQVKEHWGRLTDDDLTTIEGQRDNLVGRIQERYGLAKEKAAEQVEEFERKLSRH